MMRRKQNDLLPLVQSFFCNYLQRVRGASEHTIRAYRDTLRLFFLFMARRRGGSAAETVGELLERGDLLLLIFVGGELLLVAFLALAQVVGITAGVGDEFLLGD